MTESIRLEWSKIVGSKIVCLKIVGSKIVCLKIVGSKIVFSKVVCSKIAFFYFNVIASIHPVYGAGI